MIEVHVQRLGGPKEVFRLRPGTYVCGSSPSSSIVLHDEAVEASHLELRVEGGRVHARALTADPGLRMSGAEFRDRPWPSNVPMALGLYRLEWRRAGGGAKSLIVMDGKMQGRRYPVLGSTVTVGRSLDRTIALDDERVSRFHAILREVEGTWTLEDVGSVNGTFVNGHRTKISPIHEGDYIRIGSTLFRWDGEGATGGLAAHDSIAEPPSSPDEVTEAVPMVVEHGEGKEKWSRRTTSVLLSRKSGHDAFGGDAPSGRERGVRGALSSFDGSELGAGILALSMVAALGYWLWNFKA